MNFDYEFFVHTSDIQYLKSTIEANIPQESESEIRLSLMQAEDSSKSLSLGYDELVLFVGVTAGILTAISKILSSYFKEKKGSIEIMKRDGTYIKFDAPIRDFKEVLKKFFKS